MQQGITSDDGYVGGMTGGIVGFLYYTTVNECFNSSTVTGGTIIQKDNYGQTVGGIVGCQVTGIIKNSYNIGAIKGKSRIAGIVAHIFVGEKLEEENYMYNCYNAGELNGDECIGEILGDAYRQNGSYIGMTSANNGHGNWDGYGTWNNCIVYDNTEEMKDETKLLVLMNSGESNDLWDIDTTGTINSGLPYLKNNKPI